MDTRREFIRKAVLLPAGGGGMELLSGVIRKAQAIEPEPGSTWRDAEHVVILMQENRSFDHCYGTLRGVRGFDDPRAVTLPDGNPVWLQTNAAGESFAPFRLDIRETNATWMGCLPHGWADQSAARNDGRHDRWLDVKASDRERYAGMPLTLGYYTREDVPFYYALADAFTICDQNFCSSLTGTTPNRLFLWTGTIRPEPSTAAKAHVRNSDADHATEVNWTTLPERLEDLGVSWRIYQNELSVDTGLGDTAAAWLSNFGDNPIEYFTQFHVHFAPQRREFLRKRFDTLFAELERLEREPRPWTMEFTREAAKTVLDLEETRVALEKWTAQAFAELPARQRALHEHAFAINSDDPNCRELESLTYRDGGTERKMHIPKGDILHRFREDVGKNALPMVSWIVAPQHFSDHPDSPWFGAWYLAEVINILTRNPAVWKKTIFILCYDENDGYFDHVPPFVPPHPDHPGSGRASEGLETELEFVTAEQEAAHLDAWPRDDTHVGPVGLGFRVPLVIASPWSRGGYVCSQVFDHTSIVQFIEKFVSHKSGRVLSASDMGAWRRAICGDLTSAFRAADAGPSPSPEAPNRLAFMQSIDQARFRPPPECPRKLESEEIALVREHPLRSPRRPRQDPGTRPSCALPYELAVHGALDADRRSFVVRFAAGREFFGDRAAGAPFHVYSPALVRVPSSNPPSLERGRTWAYAVKAGDEITDSWPLDGFENGAYHLRIHGPNGFFREFRGDANDPAIEFAVGPEWRGLAPTKRLLFRIVNPGSQAHSLTIEDLSYDRPSLTVIAQSVDSRRLSTTLPLDLESSSGWYDLRVRVAGAPAFEQRFAGRLETGRHGISDPAIGRTLA